MALRGRVPRGRPDSPRLSRGRHLDRRLGPDPDAGLRRVRRGPGGGAARPDLRARDPGHRPDGRGLQPRLRRARLGPRLRPAVPPGPARPRVGTGRPGRGGGPAHPVAGGRAPGDRDRERRLELRPPGARGGLDPRLTLHDRADPDGPLRGPGPGRTGRRRRGRARSRHAGGGPRRGRLVHLHLGRRLRHGRGSHRTQHRDRGGPAAGRPRRGRDREALPGLVPGALGVAGEAPAPERHPRAAPRHRPLLLLLRPLLRGPGHRVPAGGRAPQVSRPLPRAVVPGPGGVRRLERPRVPAQRELRHGHEPVGPDAARPAAPHRLAERGAPSSRAVGASRRSGLQEQDLVVGQAEGHGRPRREVHQQALQV